ncbi:hypothetical protein DESA109040_12920 [Deinococcus saxicola]
MPCVNCAAPSAVLSCPESLYTLISLFHALKTTDDQFFTLFWIFESIQIHFLGYRFIDINTKTIRKLQKVD